MPIVERLKYEQVGDFAKLIEEGGADLKIKFTTNVGCTYWQGVFKSVKYACLNTFKTMSLKPQIKLNSKPFIGLIQLVKYSMQ